MQIIKSWEELAKVKPSPTHRIVLDEYSGWIESLDGTDCLYLSTHTFYEETDNSYENGKLKEFGFNIELRERVKNETIPSTSRIIQKL